MAAKTAFEILSSVGMRFTFQTRDSSPAAAEIKDPLCATVTNQPCDCWSLAVILPLLTLLSIRLNQKLSQLNSLKQVGKDF